MGGPADPYSIGTTCEILSVTPLEEGRLNLTTVGRQRFRILRLHQERPYLEAEIELLPETGETPPDLLERVHERLTAYIQTLLEASGETNARFELPEDPAHLSWVAGAVLQVPPSAQQDLLEIPSTWQRLEAELLILQTELDRLAEISDRPQAVRPVKADPSRVSLN